MDHLGNTSHLAFCLIELDQLFYLKLVSFMRYLLFAIAPAFLFCNQALADFGSADTGGFETNEIYSFDAWCGKPKNNCKIEFKDSKIVIDGSSYVTKDQIQVVRYSVQKRKCAITRVTGNNCLMPVQQDRFTIDIAYLKREGTESTARVIFQNLNSGRRFLETISEFKGIKPDEMDKSTLTDR